MELLGVAAAGRGGDVGSAALATLQKFKNSRHERAKAHDILAYSFHALNEKRNVQSVSIRCLHDC